MLKSNSYNNSSNYLQLLLLNTSYLERGPLNIIEIEEGRSLGDAFIAVDSELNLVLALQETNPENNNIEDLQIKYIIKKFNALEWQKPSNKQPLISKYSGIIKGLLPLGAGTIILENSATSILLHNLTHDN